MTTTARFLLCVPGLYAVSLVRGESVWAVVPASPDARSMASLSVPDAPTEAVVRLVGDASTPALPAPDPRPVLVVDVSDRQARRTDDEPLEKASSRGLPDGVRWPDSAGRIVAVLPEEGVSPTAMRNPWEIRTRPKQPGNESVFACGGIVAGGAGGPIAFVNGHVVRPGDALGKFRVACILREGVVLGREGLLLVLPVGQRTTVSTIGG